MNLRSFEKSHDLSVKSRMMSCYIKGTRFVAWRFTRVIGAIFSGKWRRGNLMERGANLTSTSAAA